MGCSARTIAVSLGSSPSTISREIARNGSHATYRAAEWAVLRLAVPGWGVHSGRAVPLFRCR